jgi:hypothetical protein
MNLDNIESPYCLIDSNQNSLCYRNDLILLNDDYIEKFNLYNNDRIINGYGEDDENETNIKKGSSPFNFFSNNSNNNNNNNNNKRKKEYYTITGRTEQQSRQFTRFCYKQVGTFLTQYKIRENYKFLQMISVPPLDPAVPKPESGVSVPACGEPLVVPSSFPQSIEAAIHKFANASSKTTCISVLDQSGKAINSLTYGKYLRLIN